MTFSTIGQGQFPLQNCLIMLVIDTILYLLLAAYFDNVIPSKSVLLYPSDLLRKIKVVICSTKLIANFTLKA